MNEENLIPLIQLVRHDTRSLQFLSSRGYVVIARRKSSGKNRTVPLRSLLLNNPQFFRGTSDYEYLVTPDTASAVYEAFPLQSVGVLEKVDDNAPAAPHSDSKPPNFGQEYQDIVKLDPIQRINLISEHAARLEALTRNPAADSETVNRELTQSTIQAAMINKATIQEALRMGNAEAQRHSASLVAATENLMRGTEMLLDSNLYKEDLIQRMVQRSNGTVVQHMTRVFLMGFSFLLYYNHQYSNTSLAGRIRARFSEHYRPYYRKLLPHIDKEDITLERVFWGGMRPLTLEEIRKFAMGYLIHDIGKVEDIEYHEGEAGFDREKVVRHVKLGYKAVMEKTVYPREAALITGYHHEYYGAPSGYGYFRELLERYKQMNPEATINHLMSYEMEPLIDYQVLAYFPAKMLEVVDVFDSLTDENRLYRKALSERDTVQVLRLDFLEKKVKVDPIILDLFEQFLTERGILN